MSADQIRTIGSRPMGAYFSVIVGTLIGHWLTKKWSRWIPAKSGQKGRARLMREHNTELAIAKVLSFAGLCTVLLFYQCGWVNVHDWRGIGLGVGLMCFLPLAYMAANNFNRGREAIKECMVTYAISQKAPVGVLVPLMSICLVAGFVSAISLLLRP